MSHWKDFLDAGARGGRYLAWKEVGRATGLSRTTAWRLQKRGEFPPPYAISPGRVGYREDEVEAWRVSRDHSAARTERRTKTGVGPPTATLHSAAAPRAEGPTPSFDHGRPTELVSPPVPAALAARTVAGRLSEAASAKRTKPARRRSQHAQAIAQQILFDF